LERETRLILQLVAQTEGHVPGSYRTAPSDESVQSLTPPPIRLMVEGFVVGAQRAEAIGFDFDGIQVHAGHHHAISPFLSPHYHERTQQCNGGVDRRMNFALEVIQGIRPKVRPDFPVVFRVPDSELVCDGLQMKRSRQPGA
jgi:2,4-dienoyl-CoA reductase-like NADH-dependent reductase (Old Yellow Enzyme family)